jgi:GT2 family glycosyltransferase
MQPRVTAIVVARSGGPQLERTLEALASARRRPDSLIVVDDAATDAVGETASRFAPSGVVRIDSPAPFGSAIARALDVVGAPPTTDEWLWLLTHESQPERNALAALVHAVEVAPSVAVAGPKLMRADNPAMIAEFGATVSTYGATVPLVGDELDQGQHDRTSDLLAVSANGMLVRRDVWAALGGFDPGLPSVDAALDFCVRARLAGSRIVGVPSARVRSEGGPEQFVRPVSPAAAARTARSAQLHRRLSWAPPLAVPLHWLSVLPLAVLRTLGHLTAKRPGRITGEFSAAFAALVDGGVAAARRNLSRNRSLGWRAIASLRMSPSETRRLRSQHRDAHSAPVMDANVRVRPSFFAAGGAWIVLGLVVVGVIAFGGLLGSPAVAGGGLAPLAGTVGELWANVGYGWRSIGTGFVGAADPFAAVIAVLGSLTFWAPSASVVALTIVAIPLAGLGGWWAGARFSERGYAPAVAAIAWALAPPFLSSLATGHLGAVIVHLLLPWLVLALLGAARSWASSATAAILFAAVAASAPSLLPFLLLAWFAWLVANPRGIHRVMGVPIPMLVLFLPLAIDQGMRGNWLGLLADPGVPSVGGTTSGWQLALGAPDGGANGWDALAVSMSLPPAVGSVVAAALVLALVVLALIAIARPGNVRPIVALAIALVGFLLAVVVSHFAVAVVGADPVSVWPGSALSVYWAGLIGAAVFAVERARRHPSAPVLVAVIAAVALVAPIVVASAAGDRAVQASDGRMLPAYVTAEVSDEPRLATLVLEPRPDGSVEATLERGPGTTLDEQSTLWSTTSSAAGERGVLADLAGNLVSRSGFDAQAALDRFGVAFVVVAEATRDDGIALRERAREALDANAVLESVGSTRDGLLWHVRTPAVLDAPRVTAAQAAFALAVRVALVVVFGAMLLLAVPTSRRRRSVTALTGREQATTFDPDEMEEDA